MAHVRNTLGRSRLRSCPTFALPYPQLVATHVMRGQELRDLPYLTKLGWSLSTLAKGNCRLSYGR